MAAQMLQSVLALSKEPVLNAAGAQDLIAIHADYALVGDEETNDVIEMVPIPAGHVPVDVVVDTADLGTTATAKVGVMSGDYRVLDDARTCGAEFMTGKAFGTTGIYRMDAAGGTKIAPTTGDRSIGIQLTTVDTPTAAAVVRLTALFRPAINGA